MGRLLLIAFAIPLLGGCGDAKYTQAGMCGGRPSGWLSPSSGIGKLSPFQTIHISRDDSIRWNGETITPVSLSRNLHQLSALSRKPQASLIVETGADCSAVEDARARMQEALDCKSWGCGEWPAGTATDALEAKADRVRSGNRIAKGVSDK